MLQRVFGKIPAGEKLLKIQQSPNYKNGAFQNLSPTPVMAEDSSFWKTLKSYLNKPGDTKPPLPLPFVKTDLHNLENDAPVIVWFGHSSYLIRINGCNILIDPIFSNHAAPFSFMVKAYPGADVFSVQDMPCIDLLIQTHDHYDHLDYESIVALQPKIKKVITGLGTGSHFEFWGYDKAIITELDWWEITSTAENNKLTAVPARHFSGRGIARGKTLWAGFILQAAGYTIYIGGDSGYDTHFKEIGSKYGPFDIAILECGQYNAHWPHIHMMPEETAQAAIDLNAKMLLPVHWAKFTLALHSWNDPVKRVVKKAAELHLPITTPMIGEPVVLGKSYPDAHWWNL
ncbi:MAG: MBL fold metallo-hydrolase [Chitinophagaceae bacterium]